MLSERDDPIIAIATPPGRGAVGMVRLSGKQLWPLVRQLAKRELQPRQSHLVSIRDAQGDTIDQVLAVFFSGATQLYRGGCVGAPRPRRPGGVEHAGVALLVAGQTNRVHPPCTAAKFAHGTAG